MQKLLTQSLDCKVWQGRYDAANLRGQTHDCTRN